MADTEDSDVPETGAVFTFGKSKFAENLPNKFWVKNDRVLQVACGDEHSALVTESGRVFMFGPNDWGQLGLGQDIKGVNRPSCIKSLKHEKSKLVACGRNHTIISTESGHIYSFGSNSEGQLGVRDVSDLFTPRRVESLDLADYKMLAAGSDSSVALTEDGRVFVWGGNEDGKLGLGELVENAHEPELLPLDRPVVCIACGYYHTALVTDDGKLYTMGEPEGGKLGLPDDIENTKEPHEVTGIPDPVKWVACGSAHTVALTEFGDCYVFGDGENGQLGLGTEVLSTAAPTHLHLPFKVSWVFCGQTFTALISERGQLYTFGDGRHGKLAHGSDQYSNQYRPFHCKQFCHFSVDQVACGGCHMIVTARRKTGDENLENDGDVDEMKTLESKSLSDTINGSDGSPSLTRTLSARERRRNELQKSFSSMNYTLPALTSSRGSAALSSTMPILRSQTKMSGSSLNKTIMPKIEAVPNGKTPGHTPSEESGGEEEEHQDARGKKVNNHTLPKVSTGTKPQLQEVRRPPISPRLHVQQSQQTSGHKDGSDGDDEDDDYSGSEKRTKKILQNQNEKEDENEKTDVMDPESDLDNSQTDDYDLENAKIQDMTKSDVEHQNISDKTEETNNIDDHTEEVSVPNITQPPVALPRKQQDKHEDNNSVDTGKKQNDDDDDDYDDDDENDVKDKTQSKKKKKDNKEKKDISQKTKKNKEEESQVEQVEDEEINEKKAKSKKDKKNEKTDKKKKKDKREEDNEEEEGEKVNKKKEKDKQKEKKKEKVNDKEEKKKKVKSKKSEEEEDKKSEDKSKDKKEESEDTNKEEKEKSKNGKDKSQSNKTGPQKKSRFCTIL